MNTFWEISLRILESACLAFNKEPAAPNAGAATAEQKLTLTETKLAAKESELAAAKSKIEKLECSRLANEFQEFLKKKSDQEQIIITLQEKFDALQTEHASLNAKVDKIQGEEDHFHQEILETPQRSLAEELSAVGEELDQEVQVTPHRSLEEKLRAAREEIPNALDEMKIHLDKLKEMRKDLDL